VDAVHTGRHSPAVPVILQTWPDAQPLILLSSPQVVAALFHWVAVVEEVGQVSMEARVSAFPPVFLL